MKALQIQFCTERNPVTQLCVDSEANVKKKIKNVYVRVCVNVCVCEGGG